MVEDDAKAAANLEGKTVPIRHVFPEPMQTRFVNHAIVQQSPQGEFLLSFFEVIPPLIIGDEAERKEQVGKVESVEARCVGRFAFTRERFAEVVSACAGNLMKAVKLDEKRASTEPTPGEEKRAG